MATSDSIAGDRHHNSHVRWISWLTGHFPPGQFGSYLVIGVFNTVFAYSTYALFTALLSSHVPYSYMFANVISGFLNITVAFFNYKWFIFKTKGNYLREWLRCFVVYSGGWAVGTALLPVAVFAIRHLTPAKASAPYIAGALLMGVNVIGGFLGHKKFSFAPPSDNSSPISPVR